MFETKHITAPLEFKEDGSGKVRAAFSIFDEVDSDGDVVKASAFRDGLEVPMVPAHNWTSHPIGKGVIRVEAKRAVFDGEFFLDTTAGLDWYRATKRIGPAQNWSWGFQITDAEPGTVDGQDVRVITGADVFEVSPVLVGANRNTRTLSLKGEGLDYDVHAEQALGVMREFVERTRSGLDLRLKRGRPLAERRRVIMATVRDELYGHADGIRGHADEIDAMLVETTDPDGPKGHTGPTEPTEPEKPDGGSPEAAKSVAPTDDLLAIREAHARRMARYGLPADGVPS